MRLKHFPFAVEIGDVTVNASIFHEWLPENDIKELEAFIATDVYNYLKAESLINPVDPEDFDSQAWDGRFEININKTSYSFYACYFVDDEGYDWIEVDDVGTYPEIPLINYLRWLK
jgi:hypothetical protein